MDALFETIRGQSNSKLENQQYASKTLLAIEGTIKDQNQALTPLAYFSVLTPMLSECEDDSVTIACAYLLSIVIPQISPSVLKLKFNILANALISTLTSYQTQAPLVKSILCCMQVLLLAQDCNTWVHNALCQQVFHTIIAISTDGRPKVRRRAHEAIKQIINSPPPPVSLHPASLSCLDFAIRFVTNNKTCSKEERQLRDTQVMHLLAFLRIILPVIISNSAHNNSILKKLRTLADALLKLPAKSSGTGNILLTQSTFSVLSCFFGKPIDVSTSNDEGQDEPEISFGSITDLELMYSVLTSLLSLRPNQNDAVLTPIWTKLIGIAFVRYANASDGITGKIQGMMDDDLIDDLEAMKLLSHQEERMPLLISEFTSSCFVSLLSTSTRPMVISTASKVFAQVAGECITNGMIQMALADAPENNPLKDLIVLILGAMEDICYKDSWGGIMNITGNLFKRLARENESIIESLLIKVVSFRDNPSYHTAFPYKIELEGAIIQAIKAMGFQKFLSLVPLNVESGDPKRPYLLSLFAKSQSDGLPFGSHSLEHFATSMVPLSARFFGRCATLNKSGHEREAKLFETLGLQIWELFPVICASNPRDVGSGGLTMVAGHLEVLLKAKGGRCPLPEDVKLTGHASPSTSPDLRPIVCLGLKILVENYLKMAVDDSIIDMQDKDCIANGVEVLTTYSTGFMAMLCNNYTSPNLGLIESLVNQILAQRQAKKSSNTSMSVAGLIASSKNIVLQTVHENENQKCELAIKAFLEIADEEAVNQYFMELVKKLLESQLESASKADSGPDQMETESDPSIILQKQIRSYAIIDLLLVLLPFLTASQNLSSQNTISNEADSPIYLLYRVLGGQLGDSDVTLQKRTYKALNRVFTILTSGSESSTLQRQFALLPLVKELCEKLCGDDIVLSTGSGAKKARIELFGKIIQCIPVSVDASGSDEAVQLLLDFMPMSLSEIMLGTKEASEKARTAAFETLAIMAKKMLDSGHMFKEASDGHKAKLNFDEFMMMIVAGLAGSTSNMQSAAISCVASNQLIDELITTIMCMFKSPNREIIKAALGFVKVVVICVEQELLSDQLENMVTSILAHSRSHTSHFKAKVRHIFERLIRKFSYEAIEGFVPEDDRKLIVNIKKRKERAKKKKVEGSSEVAKGATTSSSTSRQKAFEEVLASDESDLGSDNDEALEEYLPEELKTGVQKSSNSKTQLREDGEDDEVLDFLNANIVSKVTSTNALRYKQQKTLVEPEEFAFNAKGRLIIYDSEEEKKAEKRAEKWAGKHGKKDVVMQDNNDGGMFMEALKSETALERMPNGKMKFANKRKRDDNEMEIVLEDDTEAPKSKKTANAANDKAVNKMIGRQFKAKNASGDVKKGDVDPYAYIPLNAKVGSNKKTKQQGQFKSIIKAAQKGADVKSKESKKFGGGIRKQKKKHNK